MPKRGTKNLEKTGRSGCGEEGIGDFEVVIIKRNIRIVYEKRIQKKFSKKVSFKSIFNINAAEISMFVTIKIQNKKLYANVCSFVYSFFVLKIWIILLIYDQFCPRYCVIKIKLYTTRQGGERT